MKIYDETGRYIGSVRKEELINAEEAIMPVSIAVTPAKEIALPDGFLIMAIGSMVACISMLLTFLSEQVGFSYDADGILDYFGLYGTGAITFVPLAAFIQLAAGIILAQRHREYLAYALIQMLSIMNAVTLLMEKSAGISRSSIGSTAFLDLFALTVIGTILYRHYSVKLYFAPLIFKTAVILIFGLAQETLLGFAQINMFIYYLLEAGVWIYMIRLLRRREKK